MPENDQDLVERVHSLETAQAVQVATQTGAQATQAATQAGQAATTAAAMLVPGRRWAREQRASSSASSSVCPSPSPDAPAPQQNVIRQWPVPTRVETGHCRYRSMLRARGKPSRVALAPSRFLLPLRRHFPAVDDRGRNVIVRAREKRPKQSR